MFSFWKRGPGPPLWGPEGVLGPLDPGHPPPPPGSAPDAYSAYSDHNNPQVPPPPLPGHPPPPPPEIPVMYSLAIMFFLLLLIAYPQLKHQPRKLQCLKNPCPQEKNRRHLATRDIPLLICTSQISTWFPREMHKKMLEILRNTSEIRHR